MVLEEYVVVFPKLPLIVGAFGRLPGLLGEGMYPGDRKVEDHIPDCAVIRAPSYALRHTR